MMKKKTYDSWHNFTLCMLHNRTLHIGTWVELEYTICRLHNITSHTDLTAQDLTMTICRLHNITSHTGLTAQDLTMTICKLYNITSHTGLTAQDLTMTMCKLYNITSHTGSMAWFLNMTICKLYNIILHTVAWDLNNWKQINWSWHRPAWPASSCSFPRPPESWPRLSPQTPLPHYPADHWENKSQQGKWSEHTQPQSNWENNYVSPLPQPMFTICTVKMGK